MRHFTRIKAVRIGTVAMNTNKPRCASHSFISLPLDSASPFSLSPSLPSSNVFLRRLPGRQKAVPSDLRVPLTLFPHTAQTAAGLPARQQAGGIPLLVASLSSPLKQPPICHNLLLVFFFFFFFFFSTGAPI
ncbi:hypothetical protein ATANTOWER_015880 [Ataeniobius toweri]|uniref:Transmembrane protein n=1 Tax=Ataeniobius toweri TaxID=208326 RepID=A0ABU7C9Q5_9TELE|nr:hypothetical protein [Ataeniobius toweri]